MAGLAACSGGSHLAQTSVRTPADALAALAEKGAAASYSATYTFHQAAPDTTASVQVWRAGPPPRAAVVAPGTTPTPLVAETGPSSSSLHGAEGTCLLLSGGGAGGS